MPGQTSSVGVPNNLNVLSNWSICESPGNSGCIVNISANIHPTLHISTAVEYCGLPNNISGALYQSVTTLVCIKIVRLYNNCRKCSLYLPHAYTFSWEHRKHEKGLDLQWSIDQFYQLASSAALNLGEEFGWNDSSEVRSVIGA